jgi:hypothetical protein
MTLKTRMMNRFTVTLAFGLLLAGCARFIWVKAGASQQDFQRDAYECERDMRQSGYFGSGILGGIEAQNFQERCMVARDWSKQRADGGASSERRSGSASSEVRSQFQKQVAQMEQQIPRPFPCDPGYQAFPSGYVVDIPEWAEAAGLRRGDKLTAIAGIPIASNESRSQALFRVPTGGPLLITVVREGREQRLPLPCRDHSKAWEAMRATVAAGARGDWEACEIAANQYRGFRGLTNDPGIEEWRGRCALGRVRDHGGRTDNALANRVYQWDLTMLRAVRYEPGGLDIAQGTILTHASLLRKDGFVSLASDLEAEFSKAAQEQIDRSKREAANPAALLSTPPVSESRVSASPPVVATATPQAIGTPPRPDLPITAAWLTDAPWELTYRGYQVSLRISDDGPQGLTWVMAARKRSQTIVGQRGIVTVSGLDATLQGRDTDGVRVTFLLTRAAEALRGKVLVGNDPPEAISLKRTR